MNFLKTLSFVFSLMKGQTLKKVLKASYSGGKKNIDGYEKNEHLSGKRVQVYHNPKTNKTIVSHRGSHGFKDWVKTDAAMALGYEGGKRFKHSKRIQKKAEKEYGADTVTTVGHSLGGRIAEKVGKKSDHIITYNKAVTPKSMLQPTSFHQTDIRTKHDVVSSLGKFQKKRGHDITLNSNRNPIGAHNISHLKQIKRNIINKPN